MSTETLYVELAERAYPIHFGETARAAVKHAVAELRASGRSVALLADARVLAEHSGFPGEAGFGPDEVFTIPPGETSKSTEQYDFALRFLAARPMNRDGAVFALGGGVTGDLAGFVAASYLRGVDFYQVPTTLLAMVDSSVGGKTGINLPEGKNLVGAFWQPKAVFIIPSLLETLSSREFNAGMAEVIKYGLLDDESLFTKLENAPPMHPGAAELPGIIRTCCAIKARIVAADERETAVSGGRALLNLGHTFAHAIEQVAGYGHYLHGEAVAIGLFLAARLSTELGHVGASVADRVREENTKYRLPSGLLEPLATADLMAAMLRDKKTRGGQLRFITLDAIGRAISSEGVGSERIEKLWAEAGAA